MSPFQGEDTGSNPVRAIAVHNLNDAVQHILTRLYAGHCDSRGHLQGSHRPKAERNAAILARYQAGDTLREIASKFDISVARVQQIIKRNSEPSSY